MKLSIVIPTFDNNRSASRLVADLRSNNAEIVVVDDGSMNPIDCGSGIRVIAHDHRRGRAAAINTGLRAATHDMVLLLDDDIVPASGMVERLFAEYEEWNNPRGALAGRVLWHPELDRTLTMRWIEEFGWIRDLKGEGPGSLATLTMRNTIVWRPFLLDHGGLDEEFAAGGLEDTELGIRLSHHGLEIRRSGGATGYYTRPMRVADLVRQQFEEGESSVRLHGKFPRYLPRVSDTAAMIATEQHTDGVSAATQQLVKFENENGHLDDRSVELFLFVCQHNLAAGTLAALRHRQSLPPSQVPSTTLAAYNHASLLERQGKYVESRLIFESVLASHDPEYVSGAHYHLGCIEQQLGNDNQGRHHLIECLRFNPGHKKAREALGGTNPYREVHPDIHERPSGDGLSRALFVQFGPLSHILNSFPVVRRFRERLPGAEVTWLTQSEYRDIALMSAAGRVVASEYRSLIDWRWVESEQFTHVYRFDLKTCMTAWRDSRSALATFIGERCRIPATPAAPTLQLGVEDFRRAETILRQRDLAPGGFVALAHVPESGTAWPDDELRQFIAGCPLPVLLIGASNDPVIPGAIPCFGQPWPKVAAILRMSRFYLGVNEGISWLAVSGDTPVGILTARAPGFKPRPGVLETLGTSRPGIVEWTLPVSAETVLGHLRAVLDGPATTGVPSVSTLAETPSQRAQL